MSYRASVHAKAVELTRLAVQMTAEAGSGHPTSAASLAHLVTVLLYDVMKYDRNDPGSPAADRLVLSEGHACPIVYAAAADIGLPIGEDPDRRRPMRREDILTLRRIDSPIDGHPNPAEGFPFFPAATGSLGQGLSIAAGLALGARLDGSDRRIFCLIGDGESREGQIWEAADLLVDYNLTAVCPIFNCNVYGQTDEVSSRQSPESLAAKLEAFGLDARVVDGHDPEAIRQVLRRQNVAVRDEARSRPVAVVAKTVKGWGMPSVQGNGHHGKPIVDEKDRRAALDELDRTGRRLGARWKEGDLHVVPPLGRPRRPAGPGGNGDDSSPPATLRQAAERFGYQAKLAQDRMATRDAYGVALRALGHADRRVVALDGDVRNSTRSRDFHDDEELAGRFFECRMAEQNMLSTAGGLAAAGKIPFVSTFGKFVTRGYDQLELALVSRFNLKVIGSHAGVTPAADGPSQMALSDVPFFRALSGLRAANGRPLLYLLQPADANAAYALTLAMARREGPCYLRTHRPGVPFLYDDAERFEPGGHKVVERGKDVLIVTAGYMVHECRKAVQRLQENGVRPTLVDLYSIPFDEKALASLARENGGRVLTVEDNYRGGIGSAVSDALLGVGGAFAVRQMYVRRIPKSGRTPDDVLRYLGLSAADIIKGVARLNDLPAGPFGTAAETNSH